MKKMEKIISALLTIALGVLLIILRGEVISILMTVVGLGLIVIGVLDLVHGDTPIGIVKLVGGILIILCGWIIVQAVLYIVAAVLLIAGILVVYEKWRSGICFENIWQALREYADPILFIVIGCLLLFNQGNTVQWVFVISGALTVVEGGLLLVNALTE